MAPHKGSPHADGAQMAASRARECTRNAGPSMGGGIRGATPVAARPLGKAREPPATWCNRRYAAARAARRQIWNSRSSADRRTATLRLVTRRASIRSMLSTDAAAATTDEPQRPAA